MGMRVPQAPPRRWDVTREFVEARLGVPMVFVGLAEPPAPRVGQCYVDQRTQEVFAYNGQAWVALAGATDARTAWVCAYCGTHFGEPRCPTCGAGRTEG